MASHAPLFFRSPVHFLDLLMEEFHRYSTAGTHSLVYMTYFIQIIASAPKYVQVANAHNMGYSTGFLKVYSPVYSCNDYNGT